jgi:hypothetical protein
MKETPSGSFARETGNAGGTRARIPNGKIKCFYHSYLSGWRPDAAATGEEQLGRFTAMKSKSISGFICTVAS